MSISIFTPLFAIWYRNFMAIRLNTFFRVPSRSYLKIPPQISLEFFPSIIAGELFVECNQRHECWRHMASLKIFFYWHTYVHTYLPPNKCMQADWETHKTGAAYVPNPYYNTNSNIDHKITGLIQSRREKRRRTEKKNTSIIQQTHKHLKEFRSHQT